MRIVNAAGQVVTWLCGAGGGCSIGTTKYEEEQPNTQPDSGRQIYSYNKSSPMAITAEIYTLPMFIICWTCRAANPPANLHPPPPPYPVGRLSLVNCFIQTTALSTCFNRTRLHVQILYNTNYWLTKMSGLKKIKKFQLH